MIRSVRRSSVRRTRSAATSPGTASALAKHSPKCEVCFGARELKCIGGNDDDCNESFLHSTVEWCSAPGVAYLILVHGFSSGVGNFTLCVLDDGVPCSGAWPCGGEPLTGACCQCDGPDLFCTQETAEQCFILTGEAENFLGIGSSCEGGGGVEIYESSPGLAIPDGTGQYVCDTITVPDSFTITDLDVDLVVDHTWVGDLCVTLSKDGGPSIQLIQRINYDGPCDGSGCCGCSNNDLDLILDDEGGNGPIDDDPCDGGPLTGNYVPDEALSIYDSLDAAGDWTLCVNDNAGADTGVFVHWSLHFAVPSGLTPCEAAVPDKCAIIGSFDIKPGACPNPFNNNNSHDNGKLHCVLVGTAEIDVTLVDQDTLLLTRVDEVGGAVAPLAHFNHFNDVAAPFPGEPCDCHHLGHDGMMDLRIDVLELGDMIGNTMVPLKLSGFLTDGQLFEAVDCIRIVPVAGEGGWQQSD
jgi:subtilisin-like proprotein convertase family protein